MTVADPDLVQLFYEIEDEYLSRQPEDRIVLITKLRRALCEQ